MSSPPHGSVQTLPVERFTRRSLPAYPPGPGVMEAETFLARRTVAVGLMSSHHDGLGELGRAARAPEDGQRQQARRGARREECRLDVERILLEMRLPSREVHAGGDQTLQHAD